MDDVKKALCDAVFESLQRGLVPSELQSSSYEMSRIADRTRDIQIKLWTGGGVRYFTVKVVEHTP